MDSNSELKSSIIRAPQHVCDDACHTGELLGCASPLDCEDVMDHRTGVAPCRLQSKRWCGLEGTVPSVNFFTDDSGMENVFSTVGFGIYCAGRSENPLCKTARNCALSSHYAVELRGRLKGG